MTNPIESLNGLRARMVAEAETHGRVDELEKALPSFDRAVVRLKELVPRVEAGNQPARREFEGICLLLADETRKLERRYGAVPKERETWLQETLRKTMEKLTGKNPPPTHPPFGATTTTATQAAAGSPKATAPRPCPPSGLASLIVIPRRRAIMSSLSASATTTTRKPNTSS